MTLRADMMIKGLKDTPCKEHSDDEVCPECCEHMDMEGYDCLDCGKDMQDHMTGKAEDCWEGDR